uniref:Galectin n=1 Tax=Plectus sambesii TaxID=2011161 RepID=A0A914VN59_9BILA
MAQHPNDVAVPVPYRSKMLNELQPGQTLTVHGVVNAGCERFSVNLHSGSAELNPHMGTIPLHVSVRFDDDKIVLNSYQGGLWAEEERVKNPLKVGEPFDMRIRVHDDKYEISVDQKEIAEFKHRFPLKTVDHISIDGGVTLKGVHWGGRYFELPYTTDFQGGGLASGQRLYVYGIPKGDRFEVNLLNKAGEAAFHFNPRFGEKAVVRNAEVHGAWGNEEREGHFPFKKDIGFDLVIVNEPFSIQIFVDGERFGTFAHRGDPSDYARLRIAGDLELTGVEIS